MSKDYIDDRDYTPTRKLGRPTGVKNSHPPKPHEGGKKHIEDTLPAGDNSKYLQHEIKVNSLPPIDIDDPEALAARIEEYFDICIENDMKPTVNGLANAIKVTRTTLQKWGAGEVPSKHPMVQEIVRGAYSTLAALWEDYMGNGKINPVSGIFLGKNHFEYVDKQEMEIAPKNPFGEGLSEDELRAKYIESTNTPELSE